VVTAAAPVAAQTDARVLGLGTLPGARYDCPGSLARAQCQPKSHRGPGQACSERDGSGQPGI